MTTLQRYRDGPDCTAMGHRWEINLIKATELCGGIFFLMVDPGGRKEADENWLVL